MPGLAPLGVVAVVLTGVAAGLVARRILPPTRRLAGRVRPYTVSARTSLGRSADVRAVASPGDGGTLRRLLEPPAARLAGWVAARVDGRSEEVVLRRLRQADLLGHVPAHRRVAELRMRELGATATGAGLGLLVGLALPMARGLVVLLVVLGAVAGATRWRGWIDRTIEDRRTRMRIELYTVNQLLALNVRVGGGIVQATRRVVERGSGLIVDELAEVLRLHESGVGIGEAFARAGEQTPEHQVARTYRLLAAGAEHGADLAEGLLSHSEDLRQDRRETLRRSAIRRRAAMLVPIIVVLAPVMLLFVGAPLPSFVFGAF